MNTSKTLYLSTNKTAVIKVLFILNSCLSILCSVGIGSFAYRSMNRFYKLLFLQVIVWLLFYVLSYFVYFYKDGSPQKYNTIVFNVHLLIETFILILAAYEYLKPHIKFYFPVIAYVLFLSVYVFQFLQKNIFFEYFNLADLSESLLMILSFGFLLFVEFFSSQRKNSALLICSIGLFVYFICSVPYISVLNYLNGHYPKMNSFLFAFINDVLANVRYFSLAIAFWLIRHKAHKFKPNHV